MEEMAKGGPSSVNIEYVRIVHAEDDLEDVIRELAKGLEHHLKLPGQADYDRKKAPDPEYINTQLDKVINMKIHTVFYMTSNVLLLYKKKKKQSEALKNLLKRDANGQTKRIAIIWGAIKDTELVKKVLNVDHGKVQQFDYLKGIQTENFSPSELANIVEAVLKIWKGPDAVLPTSKASWSHSMDGGSVRNDDIVMDVAPVLQPVEGSNQLAPPQLTMVYYGEHEQMKFVADLSFFLMVYLKLSTSAHYYSFFKNDAAADVKEKILNQLRGVADGCYKGVLVLSADFMKLINSQLVLEDFERLCRRAVSTASPNIVFLLHNISMKDVCQFSSRLADIIKDRRHVYQGKEHVEATAFSLKRYLQDRESLGAEENDESTMYRGVKPEYNHHETDMISTRENGNIPHPQSKKDKVVSASGDSIMDQNLNIKSDLGLTSTRTEGRADNGALSPTGSKASSGGSNLNVSLMYTKASQQRETQDQEMARTADGSNRPHSLISKTPNNSLPQGSIGQTRAQSLQSQELPSNGQTGSQTSVNPAAGTSSAPAQHVPPNQSAIMRERQPQSNGAPFPSNQPQAMNYRSANFDGRGVYPAQPHAGVSGQAFANGQPTGSDPWQYFRSNPEAFYQMQLLQSQLQSQSVPISPLLPWSPVIPGHYGFPPQQPPTTNNPGQPVSTQGHYGISPHQPSTATNPAQPVSAQGHYGFLPQQPPTTNNPAQPVSAQGYAQSVHHRVPTGAVPMQPASTYEPQQGSPKYSARLSALPTDIKHSIEQKLNIKKVCGFYWRHFAEEIGVSNDEIGVWESQNDCNYMKKLFEWIRTNNENYTVGQFKSLTIKFKRPDINKLLEELPLVLTK